MSGLGQVQVVRVRVRVFKSGLGLGLGLGLGVSSIRVKFRVRARPLLCPSKLGEELRYFRRRHFAPTNQPTPYSRARARYIFQFKCYLSLGAAYSFQRVPWFSFVCGYYSESIVLSIDCVALLCWLALLWDLGTISFLSSLERHCRCCDK